MASDVAQYGQRLLDEYRRRDNVNYRPYRPVEPAVFKAPPAPPKAQARAALPRQVKTYPTLNVAFMRQELAAAGRVLYLLQAMDEAGRGGLSVDDVRDRLTSKTSPWRIFCWRRLRQIFDEGEGRLWHRAGDMIWLHSPARIARALQCGRLRGNPVYIPTEGLTDGMRAVNAHFYASYESSRPEELAGNPMSRDKLEELTGVSKRRQREYDAFLGRQSRANVAITDIPYTQENLQEWHWEQLQGQGSSKAAMRFVDWLGKRGGEAEQAYIAYRLPSTRTRCHLVAPRGRQKKHNRDITLVKNPAQGPDEKIVKLFHASDEAAAHAFNRNPDRPHYYRTGGTLMPDASKVTRLGGVTLWHELHM